MHLIARKSSEQRCSLFQGQIQYYHKHCCFMYSKCTMYISPFNSISLGFKRKKAKKEVYSSRRIPFSQDSTKSQNWVREKNQQTTFLWILNTWMNVNQAKWQLWIVCQSINLAARGFYQWFIITVQTKSWFGSWNVSNIRIVCLALFSYLVFNCA